MSDTLFEELFTDSVDVVFAFHGFPGAVHQLAHGRPDADCFHVRGFIEQGTTTTPFDMTVKNKVSRYHLVADAINNAGRTPPGAADLITWCQGKLAEHQRYVVEHLEGHAGSAGLDAALRPVGAACLITRDEVRSQDSTLDLAPPVPGKINNADPTPGDHRRIKPDVVRPLARRQRDERKFADCGKLILSGNRSTWPRHETPTGAPALIDSVDLERCRRVMEGSSQLAALIAAHYHAPAWKL